MPYPLSQRLTLAIVPRLAALLIRVLGATLRYEDRAEPGVTHGHLIPGPTVFALWHQTLLLAACRFRGLDIAILISRSFDGELIARTVEQLGFVAIRGSTSRGGPQGLRRMERAFREGHRCAITADGPRGPAMIAKPGTAQLAALVDAPVGTFHLLPARTWKLRSWDGFLIPKPFSRVVATWPAHVPAGQVTEAAVQAALDRAVAMAARKIDPVRVADFDFTLPPGLIAQTPPEPRGSSRMLVLNRASGPLTDDHFSSLPAYLNEGDLLVLNDSRVIPARLFATRAGLHTQASSPHPSGSIEILLTRQLTPDQWIALVRPAKKVVLGERLLFAAPGDLAPLLEAEVIAAADFGERTLRFAPTPDFWEILDRIGRIPLPPYIERDATPEDRHRYQTVFAAEPGSAAAPTAGLHFTPQMLEALNARGIRTTTVTLHVGLGTFQPVRVEDTDAIRLHEERYVIPEAASDAIAEAYRAGRRIVAVGTTSTRTLEGALAEQARLYETASFRGRIRPHTGTTNIFIAPGHRFEVVTGLLTNFHLPQSTLLMLVSAFAGREAVLAAYTHAVEQRYRFFSYGDCMLVL